MRNINEINAVESEGGIISTLMLHPNFVVYDDELQPRHFTNKENRYIYIAICRLANNNVDTIDAYNIIEALDSYEDTKRYANEITADQINEAISMSEIVARSTPEEYRMLTKKVKDAAFRRDTFQKLQECEIYCFDSSIDDIEHKVYETLDNVMLEYNTHADLREYKDIVDGLVKDMEAVRTNETKLIEFPFPILSQYVVMEPGECVCFAAPAKAGKSSILLTILVDLLKQNKSVLYVDSEISDRLFNMRLMAHLTGIKFSQIRSGNYGKEEADLINDAVEWLKTKKFIHYYVPVMDDNTLWMLAKKAKHMIDMDVVIVDYLKSNSNDDQAYSVYASLGRITDTLKNRIAGEMKVCAVTAAQTTSTGKIADSAKIARNVSTVVTIMEKSLEELDPAQPESTRKARVTYNRNGAQMTENEWIDMSFNGSLCKYWESEKQHECVEPF